MLLGVVHCSYKVVEPRMVFDHKYYPTLTINQQERMMRRREKLRALTGICEFHK